MAAVVVGCLNRRIRRLLAPLLGCGAIRGNTNSLSYSGAMTWKRILGFLLLAFLIFFIIKSPREAADVVETIFGWLVEIARSFARFLRSLF